MNGASSSSNPPPESSLLAPGFRFHPTDEELVIYYLKRKISGRPLRVDAIAEVDLYKAEPWDLPALSRLRSRDMEWYFFSSLDRKYANRSRTNRATSQGYWKTTGKDRPVRHGPRAVGMKKTLVFHVGRAPRGERTNWVMHEYRLEDEELARAGIPQDLYVLCRIFQKSGTGPQNGAQYGAPFAEEEWDEEVDIMPLAVVDGRHVDTGDLAIAPVNGRDAAVVGSGEYLQLSDFAENQDQGNQPENGGLVITDSHGQNSGSAPEEDPIFLVEGIFKDQGSADAVDGVEEFFDSMNENTDLSSMFPRIPRSPFYDFFVEPNDLNPRFADYPCDEADADNLIFCDASSNDLPVGIDSFVQMSDLYSPMAGSCVLNTMGDVAAYFDSTDNNSHYPTLDNSLENFGIGSLASSESIFSPEVRSSIPESVQAPDADVDASSVRLPGVDNWSNNINKNVTVAQDSEGSQGCDRTLTRRLVNMLGSISAPPALAAESPTSSGKLLGRNSATNSASSIHVTAGMIQIHGYNVTGRAEHWSLPKNRDVGFLFSYGVASNKLDNLESITKIQSWSMSVVLRGGFYLFFLCTMCLALFCKMGMRVYCW